MSIASDWNELKKNGFKGLLSGTANKLNPLAAAPRAGALQLIRLNGLGIATRIYPALLSDSELVRGGYDIENAKKARAAWEKIKKRWISLGGSPASLEKKVRQGNGKKVFKLKGNKGGQAMVATGGTSMALIQAGTPIIIGLVTLLDKNGVRKNPFKEMSIDTTDMNVSSEDIQHSEQVLNEVEGAATEERKSGVPLDEGQSDKIWGMPKPVVYIGGTLLAAGAVFGIYKLLTRNKK